MTHFDCWASTFGETTTAIELAPEGTGYRARTRFSKFFNLPELMNIFKEVADIKTADQLHLPVPEAKFETVVVQPLPAPAGDGAAAVRPGGSSTQRKSGCFRGQYAQDHLGWPEDWPRPAADEPAAAG